MHPDLLRSQLVIFNDDVFVAMAEWNTWQQRWRSHHQPKAAVGIALGFPSVLHVELWGLLDGLHAAWKKGANHIMVETDSAEAIYLVTRQSQDHDPTILRWIREILHKSWMVNFALIPREINSVADAIACHGYMLQIGISEWKRPPDFIRSLLQ
ncbi:hypothetical protein F3Y22_tig00110241pilonHSYRG00028 [Hibiscus syriacus]|uniref:RNase H type-1 domain-containing protein n=1 Tax=Hibiscus syriacus TaxID=106335 RepID=A0A6A3B704_HIBSY|nr:hypothetical protein F3Y22_tig00110241pilonHSYRG00028 [Hibiscus syriacus]